MYLIAWRMLKYIEYIYKLMYIYSLLLYNISITDIEHSPNYTAFGLSQTHQVK